MFLCLCLYPLVFVLACVFVSLICFVCLCICTFACTICTCSYTRIPLPLFQFLQICKLVSENVRNLPFFPPTIILFFRRNILSFFPNHNAASPPSLFFPPFPLFEEIIDNGEGLYYLHLRPCPWKRSESAGRSRKEYIHVHRRIDTYMHTFTATYTRIRT